MAEHDDKTEEPTAKKLSDAKEEGQVPRSRELNSTVILMTGAVAVLAFSGRLGNGMERLMRDGLTLDRRDIFQTDSLLRNLGDLMGLGLEMLMPFIFLALAAVFIPPMAIGGFTFSRKALQPKFSRLDPVKGMKKFVSINGLVELGKSILKVAIIAGVAWWLIAGDFGRLMNLGNLPVESAIAETFRLVGWSFLIMCAATMVVAAVDAPYQLWNHRKQLRMSRQEVKDEHKNMEGDPEVKGRIRRMQQELAMQRMMEKIPEADVVVTNPTHFAVALKYDGDRSNAPRVVAKGVDLVAARIRDLAREHNVPIFEAPPLARAIYHSTELEQEIPEALYLAVAQVLAYVYQLRTATHMGGDPPPPPRDIPVPDDFLHPPRGTPPAH
ncbi:MAG TPA: flagellar type III secretion system protein FlhB [Thiotrichales bacterium]|nr:flagellar type III secretion system protein FlhB [Thiotrichales bacterium]